MTPTTTHLIADLLTAVTLIWLYVIIGIQTVRARRLLMRMRVKWTDIAAIEAKVDGKVKGTIYNVAHTKD